MISCYPCVGHVVASQQLLPGGCSCAEEADGCVDRLLVTVTVLFSPARSCDDIANSYFVAYKFRLVARCTTGLVCNQATSPTIQRRLVFSVILWAPVLCWTAEAQYSTTMCRTFTVEAWKRQYSNTIRMSWIFRILTMVALDSVESFLAFWSNGAGNTPILAPTCDEKGLQPYNTWLRVVHST